MYKYFLAVLMLTISISAKPNDNEFQSYLKKGKHALKRAAFLKVSDITDINDWYNYKELTDTLNEKLEKQKKDNMEIAKDNLEKALSIYPENPEANYFMGSYFDKKYTSDLSVKNNLYLVNTELDKALEISKYFEKAVGKNKAYTGDYLILGPSSKLTSNWTMLAMSYYYHGKKDSAIWALKEGKKRGGFSEPVLELCRNILSSCEPNAILFVNGDNDTFPMLYLQMVEGFRKDITFVNTSIINLAWIIKVYKHSDMFGGSPLPFSFADESLTEDSEDPKCFWKGMYVKTNTKVINITEFPAEYNKYAQNDSIKSVSIEYALTKYGENNYYISMADAAIMDLIEQVKFSRPIYFSITADNSVLKDYTILTGFAYRVLPFSLSSRKSEYQFFEKDIFDNIIKNGKKSEFAFKSVSDYDNSEYDSKRCMSYYFYSLMLYQSQFCNVNKDIEKQKQLTKDIEKSKLGSLLLKMVDYYDLKTSIFEYLGDNEEAEKNSKQLVTIAEKNIKKYPMPNINDMSLAEEGGFSNYWYLCKYYLKNQKNDLFKDTKTKALEIAGQIESSLNDDIRFLYINEITNIKRQFNSLNEEK